MFCVGRCGAVPPVRRNHLLDSNPRNAPKSLVSSITGASATISLTPCQVTRRSRNEGDGFARGYVRSGVPVFLSLWKSGVGHRVRSQEQHVGCIDRHELVVKLACTARSARRSTAHLFPPTSHPCPRASTCAEMYVYGIQNRTYYGVDIYRSYYAGFSVSRDEANKVRSAS